MAHNNHLTEKENLVPQYYRGYEYRVYKAFRTIRFPNEGYEYMVETDSNRFDSQYETANSDKGFTKKDAIQYAKAFIDEYLDSYNLP